MLLLTLCQRQDYPKTFVKQDTMGPTLRTARLNHAGPKGTGSAVADRGEVPLACGRWLN